MKFVPSGLKSTSCHAMLEFGHAAEERRKNALYIANILLDGRRPLSVIISRFRCVETKQIFQDARFRESDIVFIIMSAV